MLRPIIRVLLVIPVTLALTLTVVSQAPIAPQQLYTLSDLPLLFQGAGADGAAYGINNNGQIVGDSVTPSGIAFHAVLWNEGKVTDLGTLGGKDSHAFGINDLGQIVGESDTLNGSTHAFLYENGQMTDLAIPAEDSHAIAINNNGTITGYTRQNLGPSLVWVWERGTTVFLPALPFAGAGGLPFSINDKGIVVGVSNTATGVHAVLWRDGVVVDLGTLGGSNSFGLGVNNQTQVVGWAEPAAGPPAHAFLWQNGTMLDLQTSGIASVGMGINDLSQIVGQVVLPDGFSHPFLWQAGRMTDLNTLLTNSASMNGYARAINNKGQILGDKFEPPDLELPVVLNPVIGAEQH